ncbi:integrase core domain-containing protein [Leisingera sp. S232]|uniref:integrase core domain-containing protein n=1 Tax=Leisingera sp. S232 TaxID=3415132 RepID=UPI003C7E2D92
MCFRDLYLGRPTDRNALFLLIRQIIADYNEARPHSSLANLMPSDFAAQLNKTRKVA